MLPADFWVRKVRRGLRGQRFGQRPSRPGAHPGGQAVRQNAVAVIFQGPALAFSAHRPYPIGPAPPPGRARRAAGRRRCPRRFDESGVLPYSGNPLHSLSLRRGCAAARTSSAYRGKPVQVRHCPATVRLPASPVRLPVPASGSIRQRPLSAPSRTEAIETPLVSRDLPGCRSCLLPGLRTRGAGRRPDRYLDCTRRQA